MQWLSQSQKQHALGVKPIRHPENFKFWFRIWRSKGDNIMGDIGAMSGIHHMKITNLQAYHFPGKMGIGKLKYLWNLPTSIGLFKTYICTFFRLFLRKSLCSRKIPPTTSLTASMLLTILNTKSSRIACRNMAKCHVQCFLLLVKRCTPCALHSISIVYTQCKLGAGIFHIKTWFQTLLEKSAQFLWVETTL